MFHAFVIIHEITSIFVSLPLEGGGANPQYQDACEIAVEYLGEGIPVDEAFLCHAVEGHFVGEATSIHGNTSNDEVRSDEGGADDEDKLFGEECNDKCEDTTANYDTIVCNCAGNSISEDSCQKKAEHDTAECSDDSEAPLSLLSNEPAGEDGNDAPESKDDPHSIIFDILWVKNGVNE